MIFLTVVAISGVLAVCYFLHLLWITQALVNLRSPEEKKSPEIPESVIRMAIRNGRSGKKPLLPASGDTSGAASVTPPERTEKNPGSQLVAVQ